MTAVSTDANKAVIRRLFEEVFADGDVDAVSDVVTADVLGHDATDPAPRRGPESVRQVAVPFPTAFPDLQLGREDLIAEGDRVWRAGRCSAPIEEPSWGSRRRAKRSPPAGSASTD